MLETASIVPVGGLASWRGADLVPADWTRELTPVHQAEIERALAHVRTIALHATEFGRADFPLATLAESLKRIVADVQDGRGVVLLRGLDLSQHSQEDAEIICWGLGLYLGVAVDQYEDGGMLAHVLDRGRGLPVTRVRGFLTNLHLPYHNDKADMVALMCLHPAMEGGQSSIASIAAVHDEMLKVAPELLEELYQPMHFARPMANLRDQAPTWLEPVFSRQDAGMFHTRYVSHLLRAAPERTGQPLTDKQSAALDLLESILWRSGQALDMNFQSGDIQILNDHVVVHSRTEFADYPEPDRKRHLLRLWMSFFQRPGRW